MKKITYTIIAISCLFFFLMFHSFTKYSSTLTILHSSIKQFNDGYIQDLDILYPYAYTKDSQTIAYDIIEHCQNNSFPNLQFSYDQLGFPSQFHISVYLNQKAFHNNIPYLDFTYNSHKKSNDTEPFSIIINTPLEEKEIYTDAASEYMLPKHISYYF